MDIDCVLEGEVKLRKIIIVSIAFVREAVESKSKAASTMRGFLLSMSGRM